MRGSIDPCTTGLGQRGRISFIGLHLPRARSIHRRVIRIGDDHLVSQCLEMLRHPLTFGTAFDQNPQHRASPKHPIEIRLASYRPSARARRSRLLGRSEFDYAVCADRWQHIPWLTSPLRLRARYSTVELTLPRQGTSAASSHLCVGLRRSENRNSRYGLSLSRVMMSSSTCRSVSSIVPSV